jgi:hypothetical protein
MQHRTTATNKTIWERYEFIIIKMNFKQHHTITWHWEKNLEKANGLTAAHHHNSRSNIHYDITVNDMSLRISGQLMIQA